MAATSAATPGSMSKRVSIREHGKSSGVVILLPPSRDDLLQAASFKLQLPPAPKGKAAKLRLLSKEGDTKILLTTIDENEKMIFELLGCKKRKFRPSIPHLVYQYSVYSDYESEALNKLNPEIPVFDD